MEHSLWTPIHCGFAYMTPKIRRRCTAHRVPKQCHELRISFADGQLTHDNLASCRALAQSTWPHYGVRHATVTQRLLACTIHVSHTHK